MLKVRCFTVKAQHNVILYHIPEHDSFITQDAFVCWDIP
jgi:hypothetical protein